MLDHWFCSSRARQSAIRNFWHAGTSWGHVIDPGAPDDRGDQDIQPNTHRWLSDTVGPPFQPAMALSPHRLEDYPASPSFRSPATAEVAASGYSFSPFASNFMSRLALDRADIFHTLARASRTIPPMDNCLRIHSSRRISSTCITTCIRHLPDALIDGGPQKLSPVLLGEAIVLETTMRSSPRQIADNTMGVITFGEQAAACLVPPPGPVREPPPASDRDGHSAGPSAGPMGQFRFQPSWRAGADDHGLTLHSEEHHHQHADVPHLVSQDHA